MTRHLTVPDRLGPAWHYCLLAREIDKSDQHKDPNSLYHNKQPSKTQKPSLPQNWQIPVGWWWLVISFRSARRNAPRREHSSGTKQWGFVQFAACSLTYLVAWQVCSTPWRVVVHWTDRSPQAWWNTRCLLSSWVVDCRQLPKAYSRQT